MSTPTIICTASYSDIDEISKLSLVYKLTTYKNILTPNKLAYFSESGEKKSLELMISSDKADLLILRNTNEIIGMIGVSSLRWRKSVPSNIKGEISLVYVKPEFRQTGAISLLMSAAKDWFCAKSMSNVVAMVLAKNKAANIFFLKNGSEIVGTKTSEGVWQGQLIVLHGIYNFGA